jgi:dienelactone hydrolase
MTDVVLFHHAQGLTPGVRAFAGRLEAAGHAVTLPDLFEGRTFTSIPDGIAYAGETGFGTLLERAGAAVAPLPPDVVYAGFSLGVMPAQMLAQTRAGARAAVLMESCVPASEFGEAWPDAVPVQVHGMDADPFFAGEGDVDAARELVASVPDGELFVYPGDQHLFADDSLASYDEAATDLLVERMLALLDRVGQPAA